MTAVQFRVIGVAGAVPLDGAEDRALEFRLAALDGQEVRRAATSVFFRPGDVVRGVPLRVDGLGGDHRAVEVRVLQQLFELGGLGGLVRDPVLGDDGLLLVQHGGKQLDMPVQHPAEPLAVDRDSGQQAAQATGGREAAQPPAGNLVQDLGVDEAEQRPDPGLAWGDDLPPQRVRLPAQVPQHLLGQVSGLVADLPKRLGPGQRARGGDREHEHQREPASPGPARVRDKGQHRQQAGNL